VPVDANTDYSRYPNQQDCSAAEPVILARTGDELGDHGDRNRHPVLTLRPYLRFSKLPMLYWLLLA